MAPLNPARFATCSCWYRCPAGLAAYITLALHCRDVPLSLTHSRSFPFALQTINENGDDGASIFGQMVGAVALIEGASSKGRWDLWFGERPGGVVMHEFYYRREAPKKSRKGPQKKSHK